jgi:hypothetical protein
MAASNGGTIAPLNLALFPLTNSSEVSFIYIFDPTNFNDAVSGSFYIYKTEDIICGRTGTINRVIISYRDLGVATITVVLAGTNDQQAIVSSTEPMTIGTVAASKAIVTQIIGISLTAQNLSLSITRDPNAGPVSITKVRMEGRVETTVY